MKVISFIMCACIFMQIVFGLGINEIPQWDLCVNGGDIFSCSGHGSCSGGQCVCTGGYTGRDCSIPPGGFGYNTPATVTQFCQLETGGCAPGMCIGGGQLDGTSLPAGIDGVAAVNPTLYGSRYAYANSQGGIDRTLNGMYSFVGQSCGTCWKLTRKSVSIVVTVIDRCAGYCRATVGDNQQCSTTSIEGGKECGECIQIGEASVPQCSCLSTNSTDHNGWCNGYQTAHCDWCAANDHPHFDLDITAQAKICADAAGDGFCHLDSFQMIDCPVLVGAWPNGYYNGTGAPAKSASSGASNEASSVQVDTTSQTCAFTTGNGECKTVNQGEFTCNGCNLTMCNLGRLWNLGCPAGTACSNGECVTGAPCDPTVTVCTAAATQATATQAPATQAPATTLASATHAPTDKPTTRPPIQATTKPTNPTTAPTHSPATQAPATPAPATHAPTHAPATQAPVTHAPATHAPATHAPATQSPATQAPATSAPATQAPATHAPATQAPATHAPATQAATQAPSAHSSPCIPPKQRRAVAKESFVDEVIPQGNQEEVFEDNLIASSAELVLPTLLGAAAAFVLFF